MSEKRTFATFKWKGHIDRYGPRHVNNLASMIDRYYDGPHELVCITDDPEGIDGSVRTVPLWTDNFVYGRDWHRLKLFSEAVADLIAPDIICMDLDTVIVKPFADLFDDDEPNKMWRDPNKPTQYCTAFFRAKPGALSHIWDDFTIKAAEDLLSKPVPGCRRRRWLGYDQAWISYKAPSLPVWTADDGVVSFKVDVMKGRVHGRNLWDDTIETTLPDHVMIVNFHGKCDPSQPHLQERLPWIADNWC